VVVTDREQLIELAKVWDRGGRHIAQSAAMIALVAKEPEDERHRDWLMYDFGQATENMMLAAGRPRHRLRPFGSHRPRAGAAGPGIPRRLLRRLPDRSGLPGRLAATANHQAQSPAFRPGRALEPLVAHAYVPRAANPEVAYCGLVQFVTERNSGSSVSTGIS